MNQKLKQSLKRFPILVRTKKYIVSCRDYLHSLWYTNSRKIITALPLYVPSSAGSYPDIAALTILAANQIFPFMQHLLEVTGKNKIPEIVTAESLCTDKASRDCAEKLKQAFNKYGSDKSTHHNYHLLYGHLLKNTDSITTVLEIGMGTNNTDVVSNMSALGKPGASLRAFRDVLSHAQIIGADIDKRILFNEERIRTFHVDQTDLSSLAELDKNTPNTFDLIIDDGLHAPNANIATLAFALKKLKDGGALVIEDIPVRALPVWYVIAALLPENYTSRIVSTLNNSQVFLVEKKKYM